MENKIKFLSPIDGDMLNDYDGKISGRKFNPGS